MIEKILNDISNLFIKKKAKTLFLKPLTFKWWAKIPPYLCIHPIQRNRILQAERTAVIFGLQDKSP